MAAGTLRAKRIGFIGRGPYVLEGSGPTKNLPGSATQHARHRVHDLLLGGEAHEVALSHQLPVHLDLEDASRAQLQRRFDAEFFLQSGRRTGGPRLVASGVAVRDRDHDEEILATGQLQRTQDDDTSARKHAAADGRRTRALNRAAGTARPGAWPTRRAIAISVSPPRSGRAGTRRTSASISKDAASKVAGRSPVQLDAPTKEIVLHAAELEIKRAALKADRRTSDASVEAVEISETAVLRFGAEIPAGVAELELEWTGPLQRPDCAACTWREGGGRPSSRPRTRAALFPCFDEPAFKATLGAHRRRPQRASVALSNGARSSQERPRDSAAHGDASRRRRCSAYLVALVVGSWPARPRRRSASSGAHLVAAGEGAPRALRPGRGAGGAAPAPGLLRPALRLRQGGPGRHPRLRGRRHGERGPHHLPRGGAAARPGDRAARRCRSAWPRW